MKFFIDTANLNEIKEAHDLGVLDGVTTNPSLMAKEGIKGEENIRAHYKAICNIVDNNVSAEVIATDFENIIKEGRELAKIDDKIVVKVPMIKDGVKAIKKFTSENIRTNCTLYFLPVRLSWQQKPEQVMFRHSLVVWTMLEPMAWNLSLRSSTFTTIMDMQPKCLPLPLDTRCT